MTTTTTITTATTNTNTNTTSSTQIPTIDISPYLTSSSPNVPAAQAIISSVRTACTTTGFFQITGHGIPRSVQRNALNATEAFFNLPLEEKKKLSRGGEYEGRKAPSNRGYEVMGTQALEKGQGVADLKEGFYIAAHLPPTHPLSIKYPQFAGPNLYPTPSVLPPESFKDPMTTYYTSVLQLIHTMFSILAAGLPYGPDVFATFLDNNPLAVIRPLHYPPAPKGSIGAGAHTDFGALTLLLQDGENGGLEVKDPDSNEWVPIPPVRSPGVDGEAAKGDEEEPLPYVVNIGDMLAKWTRGRYRSTLHRVVSPGLGRDRYSIPFFFDGNLECVLRPFDKEGDEKGEGEKDLTVVEHMTERFASTYVQVEG